MSDVSTNKLYELGIKYHTDKVFHHEYHDIYNFFLNQFYNSPGAMLEIGIQHGNSLNMWLELFPNAYIYGMDIDKEYSGERYSIIKGDQSNIDHLNNLNSGIPEFRIDPLHLKIYPANGGTIVESSFFDSIKDTQHTRLHIVTNDKDLGNSLSKIITMELLRK